MWFLTLFLGILIGHYVVADIKEWFIFYKTRQSLIDDPKAPWNKGE